MLSYLFIIIFLQTNLLFQQQDNDKIYWNENHQLKWEDFKVTHENRYKGSARSALNYHYDYTINETKLFFIVKCYFIKSKSWVKAWVKESKKSEKILSHEQTHFNIAELYARKLKKKLFEYIFFEDNVNNDFKVLTSRNFKDSEDMDQRYDFETNFSKDTIKQEFWNKKILQELDELKSFSSDTVVVILK